ncbi:MAG TPA: DUF4384 domain-containing protein [Bryobacteraceae bacterium]|nr:DUF4384 domain-containing protein [Bryobacteraceae bacterium]
MRMLPLLALFCAVALPQQDRKLSPREIFYSAPTTAAAARPAAKIARPAKPVEQAAARSKSVQAPAAAEHAVHSPAFADAGPPIVLASNETKPLGLRYSLLKRTGSGVEEVDTATAFRAGDRIRLSIEVNDPGYLYIVNRGSSGAWTVLFPSSEIAGGDNRVLPGRRYEIPSGYTFTFDETAGEEKLFVVVARKPEGDLEKLIYNLGETGSPRPEQKQPKVMLAANISPIDDMMVGRLRNAYARDLIIEKVDDKAPVNSRPPEKAVYTVNPSGRSDARVIADITLIHR